MKLFGKYKRKNILYFLSVLIVGVFIVLVVRFTYAFFVGRVNEAAGNVQVGTDTVDDLDFAVGNPLSIDATPTTLPESGANLTSSTTATATLTANSTNSQATYNYYVYLNIPSNTLVYSDGSTPEVILTVTDPSGNNVTNIEGLTYGTFSGIAGFDVTTVSGAFAVANNYAITSSSSTSATTQNWTFTLTYINHSFDQSINFGNSMSVEIIMSRENQLSEFTLIGEGTEIVGSDYSLTNMLGDIGNFETTTGWNNCTLNSSTYKYGSNSCLLTGTTTISETLTNTTGNYSLDNTHIYYGRVEAYSTITTTAGIYWPMAEPSFIEGVRVNANTWTIISDVKDRSSFTAGGYPLRMDFNNANQAGSMYFDGAMLIDLTASYGSSYPDKTYLDNHLVYFSGSANIKTINAIDEATFKADNVNNYTNITCTNGATATIDEAGTITVSSPNQDTVCKLGA